MAVLQMTDPRRTSADHVFETLYEEITKLALLPGTKMSEVDIARRFGVSRQPVRDAFARLGNLGLLLVRPQKATVVRHFSAEGIRAARFVRAAVEVEVIRRGCATWDEARGAGLAASIELQKVAAEAGDAETFHARDYEFHRLLCEISGVPFAFETIAANKAQVDRLCMLSLADSAAMRELIGDHETLLAAMRRGDAAAAEATIRLHLGRLDPTVERLRATHAEYFSD